MSSLARLFIIAICVLSLFAGCEKRVVREKSFSPDQFKQYEHLPRVKDEPKREGDSAFKKMGDSIADGAKGFWGGLKKLNPFD